MRILVTGAAGFIGGHVVNALLDRGHEVFGFDVRMNPDMDITKPHATWPLTDRQLDCVIHLAAIASPTECMRDPATAFSINVNGTNNVLAMALARGVKRFVFASTAHVYGISPKYMPTDERHPLWSQDTYTVTKILGEDLCRLYYDNHHMNYGILRLYNGYGPGQPQGYFIPDMIAKASAGNIVLKGGRTTKDFVYVADVARAFALAVEGSYVGPLNIGTGHEAMLMDVAATIAAVKNVDLVTADNDGAQVTRMCCDHARADAILGWTPTIEIGEGLRLTMQGGANDDQAKPVAPQP